MTKKNTTTDSQEILSKEYQRVHTHATAKKRLSDYFSKHPEHQIALATAKEPESGTHIIHILQSVNQQKASAIGKGFSEEESQLSAQFEYLERLHHVRSEIGTFSEAFENMLSFYGISLTNTSKTAILEQLQNQACEVINFQGIKLPLDFIRSTHGSNGLAAGCTPLETQVYTKLEVYERSLQKQLPIGIRLSDKFFQYFPENTALQRLKAFSKLKPNIYLAVQPCSTSEKLVAVYLYIPMAERIVCMIGVAFDATYALQRALTEATQVAFCFSRVNMKLEEFVKIINTLQLPTLRTKETTRSELQIYLDSLSESPRILSESQFVSKECSEEHLNHFQKYFNSSALPISTQEADAILSKAIHPASLTRVDEIEDSKIYTGLTITPESRLFSDGSIEADLLSWLTQHNIYIPEIVNEFKHLTSAQQLQYLLTCFSEDSTEIQRRVIAAAAQLPEKIAAFIFSVQASLNGNAQEALEFLEKSDLTEVLASETEQLYKRFSYANQGALTHKDLLQITQLFLALTSSLSAQLSTNDTELQQLQKFLETLADEWQTT